MATGLLEQGTLLEARYVIEEAVGRGGMGAVYRARDTRLGTTVAIKELLERGLDDEERDVAARQFETEARMLGQLTHRNLPRVTDYFLEGSRCYLVMEFIDGDTLEAILHDFGGRPIPLSDALAWGGQVADVLAYLHAQNPPIVFRDLKPANIMLADSGAVKLIDFGIARRFDASATKDTLLYGSPGYSPPEQYGRTQTDPRSDVYALGATLHHLVTGRDPSPTPFKFPPIRSIDPTLPSALESLISACVQMEPNKRIASAAEVRDELAKIHAAAPAAIAAGTALRSRAPAPARTNVSRIAIIALALLLLGAATGLGLWRSGRIGPGAKGVPLAAVSPAPGRAIASVQPGKIAIASTPAGAAIYLDGRQAGVTPLVIGPVDPGAHTVRLAAPEGSGLTDWSAEVQVAAGQTASINVALVQSQPAQVQSPQPQVAAVTLQTAAAAPVAPQPGRPDIVPGVEILASFEVTGGAQKSGSLAAYFFAADGVTPVKSQDASGTYQNSEGQLSVASSFQVDSDPARFQGFRLFVPRSAIPPEYNAQALRWRLAFYLEGKMVYQTPVSAG